MVTVFGADWCDDTRRTLRHLRRLRVVHRYVNVDEDLDALDYLKAVTKGSRRTPVVTLRADLPALVEPAEDTLTGALVELEMLTGENVHERRGPRHLMAALAGLTIGIAAIALLRMRHTRELAA